jgi:DNA invertase Pin-like site-specific DNA recombinase
VSGLLGLLASGEKPKIVEPTRRGRIAAARQGRYVAGRVPFDYRRDGSTLKIHEPEAEIVSRVFRLLAQGRAPASSRGR